MARSSLLLVFVACLALGQANDHEDGEVRQNSGSESEAWDAEGVMGITGRFLEPLRRSGIDPRPKVFALKLWECQHQIAEIAFWINRDDRNIIHCGFFENTDAEAGLTRARHADNHCMGRQILRIVEDDVVGTFVCFHVMALS